MQKKRKKILRKGTWNSSKEKREHHKEWSEDQCVYAISEMHLMFGSPRKMMQAESDISAVSSYIWRMRHSRQKSSSLQYIQAGIAETWQGKK